VEQQHGFLLLSTANFELNCLRKELIKPDLNPRYMPLCKPSHKVTQWLFGDELGKQMKDLKEQQNATYGVAKNSNMKNSFRGRYQPYGYGKAAGLNNRFQHHAAASTWRDNLAPFLGNSQRPNFRQRPQQKGHFTIPRRKQSNQAMGQSNQSQNAQNKK
jgi:hypothetical protein